MFIVKKKYFIKIITFLCAFFAVLVSIFVQNHIKKDEHTSKYDNNIILILNNVTASIENINRSFEKGVDLNTLSEESKSIYANTHNIKNMLFLTNENFSNTVLWFNELNEYAKSDMSDQNKNTDYHNKLKEAHKIFINTCQEYKNTKSTRKIEYFFSPKNDAEYYKNILFDLENQFSILDTQIKSTRSDVGTLAKNILNSPISPKIFKGNFQLPAPLSYFTLNSYANIFREGNILCKMSIEDTTPTESKLYASYSDITQKHLQNYANYAPQLTEVYSFTNNSLIYYVFCPFYIDNNLTIINYDEPIRIALSLKDGSLKAFDSSQYLKRHAKTNKNKTNFDLSTVKIPDYINNSQQVTQKYIVKNNNYFIEYKFALNNETYYCLYSFNDGSYQVYTENDHFRNMEII